MAPGMKDTWQLHLPKRSGKSAHGTFEACCDRSNCAPAPKPFPWLILLPPFMLGVACGAMLYRALHG
jgi:hypothetical protein